MFSLAQKNVALQAKLIRQGKVQLTLAVFRSTDSKYNNDEYQYIQISKTPTMHFQASLPRLPIPKLENTCQRYLNAQRPLLSEDELKKTMSNVSDFLAKDGPILQKKLLEKDSKNLHTCYISDWWFDMYLRERKPLPINYNPVMVFVAESDSSYNAQLVKATNLVISSLRFMKSLRSKLLAPEVYHLNPKKSDTKMFHTITRLLPPQLSWYGAYLFKAFPLDMSQYHNLFNTTRIPQLEKDRIYQNTMARHIVVMRNGHFYSIDVLDENDNIREPKEIATSLKFILNDNIPANKTPIGVLTASERDNWANVRSHLSSIGNDDILEKIDSAIFCMMLDDDTLGNDVDKLLRLFLHGDASNRWFDKSFSLIVTKDGVAGINFEHSWGDGVAVLRFFNDVKKDIAEKPRFHPNEVDDLNQETNRVEKLSFVTDDKVQSIVTSEKKKFDDWINRLSIGFMVYEGFGKEECKSFGVSPDAIMQLAFQLALYRQEGRVVPTYESCSTAAFKKGRTETIRPCTVQTKAICTAMTEKSNTTSISDLKNLIINCSNAHNQLTKEAAMGQGFDRHLYALNKICEEIGSPIPAIFQDPAYININNNILSTSTLSSPAVQAGGFGPVINNGYGIGYMIQNKKLGAVVTSYKDSRNAGDYVKSLEEAFQSIHKVMAHR